MKKLLFLFAISLVFFYCKSEKNTPITPIKIKPKVVYDYGFRINDYHLINDTVKNGESFGLILDRYHINPVRVTEIVKTIRPVFNVKRLQSGKPYSILISKDSLQKAQVFIYKYDKVNAMIVNFQDTTITVHRYKKPIKIVEKEVSGKIHSNLSVAMDSLHLRPNLTYALADIYAWTLDFYQLQKGDKFKFIYQEKYVNDSIFAGYGTIKAAVFTHKNKDLHAYRFVADSVKKIPEYYDEKGNMLRSQFLKSPIKFRYRISSRYNLRRRIAFYGNRIHPHKGTDFAASIGTPIMATASGTIIASTYKRGNGNYVKIKHNSIYSTQYLHMKRRKVKVGDYVKQGDIIGWVGMTGYTSGPHVCYRFWKYGKQVDPFKQKLPSAAPLKKSLLPAYAKYISPLKTQLDLIKTIQKQLTPVAKTAF